jgi:uncharacterized protein (DUF2236 family)
MTPERPLLGALDPTARTPLGRHSILRRVVAEPVMSLVIQRVLVMDVAHPKVAAAVEDHSRFQVHPWRRACVTVDAALRLVFGSTPVARGAAEQIYRTHDHIDGRVAAASGQPSAGEPYTAHDASLLLWVWATLVDSAEMAYTRWVRPFDARQAEEFYADMVAFARFVGIPPEILPVGRDAFAAYLDAMLDSDVMGSADASRSVARQILWYSHWSVPPSVVRLERVLAVMTIDPRLRDRIGLRLGAADEQFGARVDDWLRRYYRRLPRARGGAPALYLLLRRPTIGLGAPARRAHAGRADAGRAQVGRAQVGRAQVGRAQVGRAHARRSPH